MSEDIQVYGSDKYEEQRRVIVKDLPKDVITYIMSLLPMEEVVRTSVLSKDWKYTWTFVDSMQISDQSMTEGSFVNFVDKILLHSPNIRSISLSCPSVHNPAILKRWISCLYRRTNIESIKIVSSSKLTSGLIVTLPRWLLDRTSLTNLHLELPSSMKVPFKGYFCNLKSLYLTGIDFYNHQHFSNTNRVMLTFPVLKTLTLSSCTWGNKKYVEISSPLLTTFSYYSILYDLADIYKDKIKIADDFLIKVREAKIEDFTMTGGMKLNNFALNPQLVARASIYIQGETYDHLFVGARVSHRRLSINEFSSLKYLRLIGRITKLYAELMPGLPLPMFESLQELELQLHRITKYEALIELLRMAPNIKLLIIGLYDTTIDSEDYNFDAVEPVPSCMLSNLMKITFSRFFATTRDRHLVKFMLKNSMKLEKAVVSVDPRPLIQKADIEKLLLTYPKGSPCVSVVVIQEVFACTPS